MSITATGLGPGRCIRFCMGWSEAGFLASTVKTVDRRKRRVYTITKAGRKALAKAQEKVDELHHELHEELPRMMNR